MSASSTTAGETVRGVLEDIIASWNRGKGHVTERPPLADDPEAQRLGSTAERVTAIAHSERDRRDLVTFFRQAQGNMTHSPLGLPGDVGPRREHLAKLIQAESTMNLGFREASTQEFFRRVCVAGFDRYVEDRDRHVPLMTRDEIARLKAMYVALENEGDHGDEEERVDGDREGDGVP